MEQRTLTPSPHDTRPETEESRDRAGRPSRWWLWVVIALIAGLLLYFIFGRKSTQQGNPKQAAGAPGARGQAVTPVVASTAQKGDIPVYLTGLGAVTPVYTVSVKSRVDGQLMRILYREGQLVRQGQLLAEIDERPFQVQLTQAEGQLIKDQAALQNAKLDLARYEDLIKQNAVPEQQLATQRALITQDEGVVKTDEGTVASARLNITYCRITAPISGRVGLRLVDPGNMVHASDSNGLMVITQEQPITVIFTIGEDQLPTVYKRMHAGQKLTVDAFDREMKNKLSEGRLETIDNQIDQTTGTVKLRALFDNKEGALYPSQFVNARLLVEQHHDVVLVPTAAIQRNTQNTYVFLVKPDSTVTVKTVQVGVTDGQQTEIVSGLNAGDVVVTTGVDKLQEGSKIRAQIDGRAGGGNPNAGGNPAAGNPDRGANPNAGAGGRRPK